MDTTQFHTEANTVFTAASLSSIGLPVPDWCFLASELILALDELAAGFPREREAGVSRRLRHLGEAHDHFRRERRLCRGAGGCFFPSCCGSPTAASDSSAAAKRPCIGKKGALQPELHPVK